MSHGARYTEDIIYDGQEEYITKRFGKGAANTANYGWAVDEVEGSYTTKIYGHGTLTTYFTDPEVHYFHEFT